MTSSARATAPLLLAVTTAAAMGIGIATAAPAGAKPFHHSTISTPGTSRQTVSSSVTTHGRSTVVSVNQVVAAANTKTPPNRAFDRVSDRFFHTPTSSTTSQSGTTSKTSTATKTVATSPKSGH
jgi:hypothetical protein